MLLGEETDDALLKDRVHELSDGPLGKHSSGFIGSGDGGNLARDEAFYLKLLEAAVLFKGHRQAEAETNRIGNIPQI